jgi:hypothetical protein
MSRKKRMTTEAAEEASPTTLKLEAASVTLDVEAKAGEGDGPAPLPRFSMVANTGTPMKLAGWKYPVVLDLSGISIPSQARPIRYGHDANAGVGHTDSIGVQGGQLMATGIISRDNPVSRDIVSSSRNGFPWQASVGAEVVENEFVKAGDRVTVNGQEFTGPLNVVVKSTLGEISFVDLGADGNTTARVAAMAKDKEDDGREVTAKDGAEGTTLVISRAKAERKRQESIQAQVEEALSFRGADIELIQKISAEALEEGWSEQETELRLLRATRPRAPQQRKADMPTPKVLEAALCMSVGISDEKMAKDRDYGPDVVSAAWPLRTRGLRGTIAAALEASGIRVPHGSRELFDAIIDNRHIRAEGFSTVNLPGLLGNVANKILLDAFTQVKTTYEFIAEQADFANFHTHSIYRLDHLGDFALVPKDGEIKHGSLASSNYSNKLETYGQMLTLTRQDIINDDLNAFRSLTAQLARKARIAVEKALYGVIMEASDTFYTTANGNRLVGAMDITGIAAAEAAMLNMADAGGDPIFAMPRFLLVPTALKYAADQLWTSQWLNELTTANKPKPMDNPFRGKFEPISSPFLSTSTIPGFSVTTWYLIADPNILPAFQVAYLDGRRAPTIETKDAEFDTLGLQMRCYWDFGVSQLDYRGANKNTAS